MQSYTYDEACCLFKLTSLSERRDIVCVVNCLGRQSHILHCLLPAQRDDGLTGRLRPRNKYPTVRARTNRFKNSFIPYAIANYQKHLQCVICLYVFLLCVFPCADDVRVD